MLKFSLYDLIVRGKTEDASEERKSVVINDLKQPTYNTDGESIVLETKDLRRIVN